MPRSRRIGSTVPKAVVVERQGDWHEGVDETRSHARAPTTSDGQHCRRHPGDQGQPAGLGDHQPWLDLEAGQQEDETEPDIGDQLDGLALDPAEHLGPDEDPADDQQDDLGHALSGDQRGHDRRQCRDTGDDEQCLKVVSRSTYAHPSPETESIRGRRRSVEVACGLGPWRAARDCPGDGSTRRRALLAALPEGRRTPRRDGG